MCPDGVLTSLALGARGTDGSAMASPSEEESDGIHWKAAGMYQYSLHLRVKQELQYSDLWQADLTVVGAAGRQEGDKPEGQGHGGQWWVEDSH